MKTAFVSLTSKCNKKCFYCFYRQETFRNKKNKINSKNILSLLKILNEHKFQEITFTGGEPILRSKLLLKSIREASANNFKIINLNTNGTLLNQALIESLVQNGLTNLYLSSSYIDSFSIGFLKQLTKVVSVTLIHVITKENLEKLPEIVKISDKISTELIIQPAYIREDYEKFEDLSLKILSPSQWQFLSEEVKKWAHKNQKQNYAQLFLFYYKKEREYNFPQKCHMGKDDLIIDSDGTVFPCFHRQDLMAGNILLEAPSKIFNNLALFSEKTKKAKCFSESCISLFYG